MSAIRITLEIDSITALEALDLALEMYEGMESERTRDAGEFANPREQEIAIKRCKAAELLLAQIRGGSRSLLGGSR